MRLIAILGLAVLVACSQPQVYEYTPAPAPTPTGTVYVVLQGPEGVSMEITKVSLDNTVLEDSPITYNLGQPRMLGSYTGKPKTFNTLHLSFGNVMVDGKPATMPGSTFNFETTLELVENEENIIVLELLKEESIFQANQLIFAPMFRVYTVTNAHTTLESTRILSYTGTKGETVKVGMNEKGETGRGFSLPKTSSLIVENGNIVVKSVIIPETVEEQPLSTETGQHPTIITMTIVNYRASPQKLTARKGKAVSLRIRSLDEEYGFNMEGYNIHRLITPLQTETINFIADTPGTFEIHCANPCFRHENRLLGKFMVR